MQCAHEPLRTAIVIPQSCGRPLIGRVAHSAERFRLRRLRCSAIEVSPLRGRSRGPLGGSPCGGLPLGCLQVWSRVRRWQHGVHQHGRDVVPGPGIGVVLGRGDSRRDVGHAPGDLPAGAIAARSERGPSNPRTWHASGTRSVSCARASPSRSPSKRARSWTCLRRGHRLHGSPTSGTRWEVSSGTGTWAEDRSQHSGLTSS